jgi:hypothetical protein
MTAHEGTTNGVSQMEIHSIDDQRRVTRRRFMVMAASLIAGIVGMSTRSDDVRGKVVAASARDVCYWEDVGVPICIGGRTYQQRCEVCCAGGVCETVQCILVEVGNC